MEGLAIFGHPLSCLHSFPPPDALTTALLPDLCDRQQEVVIQASTCCDNTRVFGSGPSKMRGNFKTGRLTVRRCWTRQLTCSSVRTAPKNVFHINQRHLYALPENIGFDSLSSLNAGMKHLTLHKQV